MCELVLCFAWCMESAQKMLSLLPPKNPGLLHMSHLVIAKIMAWFGLLNPEVKKTHKCPSLV